MKHISFPSIEQFRNVIKQVTSTAKYHNEPVPELLFTGTVKLHGTNHAVCLSPEGRMYSQSRERITTFEEDNAGSAAWTLNNSEQFHNLFAKITAQPGETIQVFGEWCGGNIQKSVGLSYLPKMFVVFGIRVSVDSDSTVFMDSTDVKELCASVGLPSIYDFITYSLYIDFNRPETAQGTLIAITELIEKDCPVARQLLGNNFDKELIGEGAVWTTVYKGVTIRFKVKGEKHSVSRVKTLAAVDIEKVNSIREFVANVVTEARLQQGLEHVESRDAKNTGVFLKWVMSDIYKEEMDTMVGNGFTSKDVSSHLSAAIRQWFLVV